MFTLQSYPLAYIVMYDEVTVTQIESGTVRPALKCSAEGWIGGFAQDHDNRINPVG